VKERVSRRGTAALGAWLMGMVVLLVASSAALAVQTDKYDAFTACPTDQPEMNDPSREFAVCAALSADEGSLQIGGQAIPLSRLGVQLASTAVTADEPECSLPNSCLGRVPGSTTVESAPSLIPIHPGRGNEKVGNGKGNAQKARVTVESAGDVVAVSPSFLFGIPIPVFKLPVKLHLEAPWLGEGCYVGSDENPIYFGPITLAPPASFEFLYDPNGLPVELILLDDMPVADQNLAIPRAQGCGHGQGRGSSRNQDVNELLGLPSPAGQNVLALPHVNLHFVAAGYSGPGPHGGAALQAAFDAAG
jgi:hypothetical protein